MVGECEDAMLQSGISRLYGRNQEAEGGSGGASRHAVSPLRLNPQHFSRAPLKQRRRRALERWSSSALTALQVKGMGVRCRIFAGSDWLRPFEAGARSAARGVATQEIDDEFVAVTATTPAP